MPLLENVNNFDDLNLYMNTSICYIFRSLQIRRAVRKKHTLPNYKIRYRPFFTKPENKPPPQDVFMHGSKLSSGVLKVTVVECSRLVKVSPDSYIYCTVAIGNRSLKSTARRITNLYILLL